MRKHVSLALFAAAALSAGPAFAAKIDIGGKAVMTAEVKDSIVGAAALGPGAKAVSEAGVVEGNVKTGGDLIMTTRLTSSQLISIAAGPMSDAKVRVNVMSGKD